MVALSNGLAEDQTIVSGPVRASPVRPPRQRLLNPHDVALIDVGPLAQPSWHFVDQGEHGALEVCIRMTLNRGDVRSTPKNGHWQQGWQCLLRAMSGHRQSVARPENPRTNTELAPCHRHSKSATARVQPADAPFILCGKQATVKPFGGNWSRLQSFSM
jgi:hypothetical protein